MNCKQAIFFISLLFALSIASSAQNISAPNHYNTSKGLSHNNTNCIFQDSKGFIWIGTKSGLNRFDGIRFDVYKNSPEDSTSISNNYILGITEDASNNIWVATKFGVDIFNRKTNSFTRFSNFKSVSNEHITNNEIYSVFSDSKKNIWLIHSQGIERINLKLKTIKKYPYNESILFIESLSKYPIIEDKNGTIWIGTNYGLGMYNSEADDFYFFKHDSNNPNTIGSNSITALLEIDNNRIIVGTNKGLYSINSFKLNCEKIKTNIDSEYITSIQTLNNKLVYSNNSIETYIIDNKNICRLLFTTQYPITSMLKDLSNLLWIGTEKGVLKYNLLPKPIHNFTFENISNKIVATCNIRNNLFFANDEFHVYVTSENKQPFQIGSFKSKINTLQAIKNSEILIATDLEIHTYSTKTKKLDNLLKKHELLSQKINSSTIIIKTFVDHNNILWLATTQGILRYDLSNKSFLKKCPFEFTNSKPYATFFEDKNQTIFIGCDIGLISYNRATDKFTTIPYTILKDGSKNITTQTSKINSITEDDAQTIWIGTNNGLYAYSKTKAISTIYTEKKGLPDNHIYSIGFHNKKIWISTNKGIASIDIQNKTIKRHGFSEEDFSYEFTENSFSTLSSENIIFGSTKGLHSIYPKHIHINASLPNLEIISISYSTANDKKTFYINNDIILAIPNIHSNISIRFASLEFTNPQLNRYKYKIIGMHNDWQEIDNQNTINIFQLEPGTYTLSIIGSNNDMVWSKEKTILLEVAQPFWKTIWALIIYVSIIALIILLYRNYIKRKIRLTQKNINERIKFTERIKIQKEELEQKNKSITDSITYAKRIQWSMMPSQARIRGLLPESCIVYMPKDIVSGDFYWVTEHRDKIFIAAVDCTGHGVPGAFMSIIGYDLLRSITRENLDKKASEILDILKESLITLLSKNIQKNDTVKDGMDIGFCIFHKSKGILEFAGAYIPLYIIRNNSFMVISGDRFSIGIDEEHSDVNFKNNLIKVEKGDIFYLLTDGVEDQFGGVDGKKFKIKRLQQLLLQAKAFSFVRQPAFIRQEIKNWQGENFQVDDILVFGFKLDNYLKEKS